MAFSPFPQAWLGAAYRDESSIQIVCTTIAGNKFQVPGISLFQFLKVDDPVYFDNTFGTVAITANTVYYVLAIAVNGANTEFTVTSAPSFSGTPVTRTFSAGLTKTAYIPPRIWLNIQGTGLTGVPAGLSDLSVTSAARATGDIRYLFLELNKMLKRIWDATTSTDRPTRIRIDEHDFIADEGILTRNYTTEVDLAYTDSTLAAE